MGRPCGNPRRLNPSRKTTEQNCLPRTLNNKTILLEALFENIHSGIKPIDDRRSNALTYRRYTRTRRR
jgi:hypothetical protein